MMTVFFESDRLWYRPVELDDVDLMTEWINDARVRKHLDGRVFPINRIAEEEWVRRATGVGAAPGVKTEVALLFGEKGAEMPLGSTGLFALNWLVREAEWGILIGDATQWNKGYGREVARRMLRYAFIELNLNRVKLRVDTDNENAFRSYQAAGYVLEGVMRQAAWVDGRFCDIRLMSVLRGEWHEEPALPPAKKSAPKIGRVRTRPGRRRP